MAFATDEDLLTLHSALALRYQPNHVVDGVYIQCQVRNMCRGFPLEQIPEHFKEHLFYDLVAFGHVEFISDLAMINKSWYALFLRLLPTLEIIYDNRYTNKLNTYPKCYCNMEALHRTNRITLQKLGFSRLISGVLNDPHELIFVAGVRFARNGFTKNGVHQLELPITPPKYPTTRQYEDGKFIYTVFTTSRSHDSLVSVEFRSLDDMDFTSLDPRLKLDVREFNQTHTTARVRRRTFQDQRRHMMKAQMRNQKRHAHSGSGGGKTSHR